MNRVLPAALAVAAIASFAAALPSASAATQGCHSSAPSDFNGDGYSDLAVSAPGAKTTKWTTTGVVTVFRGGASGLGESQVLDAPWQQFGSALATGDFNGDGCADLTVVANGGQSGGVHEPGGIEPGYNAAVTYYGRPTPHAPPPTVFGRQQTIRTHEIDGVASSCTIAASCPASIEPVAAAADVNGDGYDDLLLATATTFDGDGLAYELSVIPGSKKGLLPDQAYTLPLATKIFPGTENTSVISQLAVGQVNADRYADVAVGFTGGDGDKPGVDMLYGSKDGLGKGHPSQLWDRDRAGVPGADSGGSSISATLGDFRGDGHDDLAFAEAGAPSVTVIYASSSGLTASGAQTWSKDSPGIKGSTSSDSDPWGSTLAAGRFGAANYDDLVVGDTGSNQISVLKGSAADGLVSADNVLWQPGQGGIPGKQLAGNAFSNALAVGEFGRGPGEDLAVGADNANHTRGTVAVLYGTTTKAIGLTRKHAEPLLKPSKSGAGAMPGDRFGAVLQNS